MKVQKSRVSFSDTCSIVERAVVVTEERSYQFDRFMINDLQNQHPAAPLWALLRVG